MPMHRAPRIPLLSRKITSEEHEAVLQLLNELGIENGWVQELDSPEVYLPDFDREGTPLPLPIPETPSPPQIRCYSQDHRQRGVHLLSARFWKSREKQTPSS